MDKQIQFHIKTVQNSVNIIKEMFKYLKKKYSFPINTKTLKKIKQDDYTTLDVIAYRFLKTQSILGEKLFKEILEYSEFDTVGKSYVEILSELERGDIIDVFEWKQLRDLRNTLAHDYPYDEQLIADALNDLYYKIETLEKIISKIKDLYDKITEIKERRNQNN